LSTLITIDLVDVKAWTYS